MGHVCLNISQTQFLDSFFDRILPIMLRMVTLLYLHDILYTSLP